MIKFVYIYYLWLWGDKILLSDDSCWGINLHDNYIYYRNQTQQGRVYRIKVDGSENKVIIDKANCTSLNVVDNFIVYRIPESTGGCFKANLDGSSIEKWAESY